jgi:hypothetical protein
MSSPNLRRLVRETLRASVGTSAPTPVAIGAAFDVLCIALRKRLQPVFGAVAVSALFARAVHVASIEFAWLAEVLPPGADACARDGLEALNGQVDPSILEEALVAVLSREIGLLCELIGDDVVMPLVYEAWALPERSDVGAKGKDL